MEEAKQISSEELKARIRLRQKIYYQTHKRKLVESAKKYYLENKKDILKSNKKSARKKRYDTLYYARHKAEILQKRKYLQEQQRLKNKRNGISEK